MTLPPALTSAALGTLFPFFMTALGAAGVFLLKRTASAPAQNALLGFAAGVMSAASVWSLLLPAIDLSAAGALPSWLPPALGLALGGAFLAALDGVLDRAGTFDGETAKQNTLLFSAITLHNVPEGMAVGLAFALASDEGSFSAAAALALGIGIQNLPEGAAISLPMHQMGVSRLRAFAAGTLSGAVEPLFGVLVVLSAARSRALMPWLLSFAAGAMGYVTVDELIPRAHSRGGTAGFAAGFSLMMILDVALG